MKVSDYALANLNMQYDISSAITFNFGVRNIFDSNYELTEGYPEPGRVYYARSRFVF